ncbi:GDSL-type esterase/lipase family protein [Christensenellaceae bacterium OttesenSCG-928-M15]|nr:GDSL-type esterase/lipase family protein [Christensenellaceae bacterium OttesenSCG-928-M15]
MNARIYGDSLMKGTVVDENYRYRAVAAEEIRRFEEQFSMKVENKARFGITVEKGRRILERDMQSDTPPQYALIEFGGNDCNFDWRQISEKPNEAHEPFTGLEKFEEDIAFMVDNLQKAGTRPVLMTLPPIDAEQYFSFISRNGNDGKSILRWLGDVHMIYRFHELYSNILAKLALKTDTPLIDVRSKFLLNHNFKKMIGIDGIHLNREGYALLFETIREFTAERLPKSGGVSFAS